MVKIKIDSDASKAEGALPGAKISGPSLMITSSNQQNP